VGHTLVIYRASERADATLAELARDASEGGGRITVLALAVQEDAGKGCCDTRAVMWNRIVRELAHDDLARARMAVEGADAVELDVLAHNGRRVWQAVAREARRRGADKVVIADQRTSGLSRRDLRRLREAEITL